MELFKLLGTIAINNSEAKQALKETSAAAKATGDDLENTGNSAEKTGSKWGGFFKKMGAGALAVGKAVGVGMVAVGGAVAGLATKAIQSYADYEQLVGGVETLFKGSASKVQEYAKNAYKTAGLSANEYMETVTSFSASLLQSLDGDTAAAAEKANVAITDMSDNANKMGTDMASIQNAYQGFAKQNYTMLDNLKLGYGGTKEEMERLLADAEKISGQKFDISSYADVVDAIHVVQTEMGITGTTAKEASSTISGSISSMKSSWQNLLTAISSDDLPFNDYVNSFVDSVSTVANNLFPRIEIALNGVVQLVDKLAPMIISKIPDLFSKLLPPIINSAIGLINALVSAMPGIVSALMGALPALIQGIVQVVNALVTALPSIVQSLVSALPILLPALIDGIISIIVTLCTMLPQIIQPIIDYLPAIIISIVNALMNNLPALIQGLITLVLGIVSAIPQIIQTLVDALPQIVSMIVTGLLNCLPQLIAGIVQIVVALVASLPQIFRSLIQGVVNVFKGLWNAVKNVFAPVGQWFSDMWAKLGNVPGLAQLKTMIEQVWGAIKSYISTVINAIKNVVSTVWNAIKNNISAIINAIKTVISSTWNTIKTIVQNVMKLISSVLKGDWQGVKNAISNIVNAIKNHISNVWNAIKNVISTVMNGIKSVVSSVWNGIKSVVSSALNTIKTVVSSVWNGIKSAISNAVKGVKTTVSTGFKDIKNSVVNIFTGLKTKLVSVGKDLISGLWNGINDKFNWLTSKVKGFANNVTDKLKSFFGIKSPSRVFRDEIGKQLAAGVAEGITENTDTAAAAAEEMGEQVLAAAEKRLKDHKVYNEMLLTDEVAYWDSVRQQLQEGTNARIAADEKYLTAKKDLNDAISGAEAELQEKLGAIQQKVNDKAAEIARSYGLFEKADYKGFASGRDLISSLDSQLVALTRYQNELNTLSDKIGDSALYKEIEAMGVDALEEIKAINMMSDSQLQTYLDKYNSIAEISQQMAEKALEDETLTATQEAYQTFADKCESLGVDVVENINVMEMSISTMFDKIGEVVSNTLSSIQTALETFEPAITVTYTETVPVETTDEPGEPGTQTADSSHINRLKHDKGATVKDYNVSWYASAMNEPVVMKKPTIFGYDPATGKYQGGGEAGSEVASGTDTLMNMIQNAVASQNSATVSLLERIIDVLGAFFPQILEAAQKDVVLDSGELVGALAAPMNTALGKISNRKDRGR